MREIATDPSDHRVLEAVIDAFGRTARSKRLLLEDLTHIVAAARHPSASVRGIGITRLAVLTHYFPDAADALELLVHHPDAEIREFAVTACANTPPALARRVVEGAVSDSWWGVRKAAASVANAIVCWVWHSLKF